ncbi:MAG: hypothetical protein IJO21_06115 [Oscillospiraceae bacterium]|nr:hypothetical protein [Oscillospiraceae bacterium]MBQ7130595.1 hypothetical protein [Oscillospiraceae bacterium]
MNHRKSNRIRWYTLGLVLLLGAGFLVNAAGTAYARYRVESSHELQFIPRALKFFHTGAVQQQTVTDDATGETVTREVFVKTDATAWQYANGVNTTTFAVSNAAADETGTMRIPQEDQHLQIRFQGSLGLWDGSAPSAVTLTVRESALELTQNAQVETLAETEPVETTASDDPEALAETQTQEEEQDKPVTITAKAISIKAGSPLHAQFGAGWIFVFQDERGQELTWTLEGGKQSYIEFTISVAGAQFTDQALAQVQIIGEPDT